MQSRHLRPHRRDFLIRALQTHHGGVSLGYSLVSVREKLKPEYMGTPGPELAKMRKSGVEPKMEKFFPSAAREPVMAK